MQPPPPAPCCTALLLPPPPLSSPALQLQACQSSSNPIHSPRASMDLARAAHAYLLNLDSGAAATDIRGLFTGVTPRHELMAPWGPYAVVLAYLVGKPVLSALVCAVGFTGKAQAFKAATFLHNALLCAYSFWTASNVVPLTLRWWRDRGVEDLYCGDGLWEAGLGYWGFLFYLSKTWELVDTAVLICKRKQPSFLQVYHHSATIVVAYWLTASHASCTFLFAGLNSSIHTVMYFYFALASIGVRLPGKSLITTAQIVQFIAGITLTIPMFVMRNGTCANSAQKFAVGGTVVHALYLTILFVAFYSQTYKSGKGSSKQKSV